MLDPVIRSSTPPAAHPDLEVLSDVRELIERQARALLDGLTDHG